MDHNNPKIKKIEIERDDSIIINLDSFKGGVGKTGTGITISELLAENGYNTLIIFADSKDREQTEDKLLSKENIKGKMPKGTLSNFLNNEVESIDEVIVEINDNLFAIPSDANIDITSTNIYQKNLNSPYHNLEYSEALKKALDRFKLRDFFDFIIIDSSPSNNSKIKDMILAITDITIMNVFMGFDGQIKPIKSELRHYLKLDEQGFFEYVGKPFPELYCLPNFKTEQHKKSNDYFYEEFSNIQHLVKLLEPIRLHTGVFKDVDFIKGHYTPIQFEDNNKKFRKNPSRKKTRIDYTKVTNQILENIKNEVL